MPQILERLISNAIIMFLLLGLVAVGLGFSLHHHQNSKQLFHFAQHQEVISTAYRASLKSYRLAMDTFFSSTINQPEILNIFSNGVNAADKKTQALARDRLYRRLFPQYMELKFRNIQQLQFHTADGKSFLRFDTPDRFGDSLVEARPSIRIANTEQRPVYGFESNMAGSGVFYVYPLSWQGTHLGTVEICVTANVILGALAELDAHHKYAFVVSRQLTEPFIPPEKRGLYQLSDLHPDFMVEDDEALLLDNTFSFVPGARILNRHLRNNKLVQTAMRKGSQ